MWMTEGGDAAEVELRNSAERERGLAEPEMSSPNSPTPNKTVLYNHRKEWTEVKLLKNCRLREKGRLKVRKSLFVKDVYARIDVEAMRL